MRFGERSDLTVATNVVLEVKDLGSVGTFFTHKVEMDAAQVILRDKILTCFDGFIIS